ncbi:RDD family protein [Sphaerisporangium fuscum]|uniref:RDD family protein n=1 Tax=Sphaerisporangium fuscum TaxID=2835868 RepID=UPI001BDBEEAF|nr:RDD family protein [Sphaerisporangium fuscum]
MTAEPPPGGHPHEPPPPSQPYGAPQGQTPQGGGYGAPQGSYGAPYGAPGAYGAPQGAPLPPGVPAPLAEWWERWVARLIDGIIFSVVYGILSSILYSIFAPSLADILANPSLSTGSVVLPGLLAGLIAFAAYAAYDYVLHSKDGQTLGKKVMKIRLAALGGGPLDSSDLLKRSAIYPGVMVLYGIPVLGSWVVPIFILVLAVLILTDKPLGQGLHDKLARTVVVKAPR